MKLVERQKGGEDYIPCLCLCYLERHQSHPVRKTEQVDNCEIKKQGKMIYEIIHKRLGLKEAICHGMHLYALALFGAFIYMT